MTNGMYIPSGLLVYTAVTGLMSAARSAKAKRSGLTEVFDASPSLKLMLLLTAIGFSLGSIYVLVTPPRSPSGATIFGLIALCGVVAYPSPIILTPEKIQQLKWWGGRIGFKWADVEKIEFHKGPSTTIVIAKGGKRIVHGGFYCATQEFRDECTARSHRHIVIYDL